MAAVFTHLCSVPIICRNAYILKVYWTVRVLTFVETDVLVAKYSSPAVDLKLTMKWQKFFMKNVC